MQAYDLPDQFGHFGQFGGTFVAETLIEALDELRDMYDKITKMILISLLNFIMI